MNDSLQYALRRSLWPCALAYGLGSVLRNATFDLRLRRVHKLDVAVVSVGNLVAGGTGKTPLVVWLVEQARKRGRKPAVLARGYGRAPGTTLNDEGMLLQARFPDLPQVQDPDRVHGGRRLLQEHPGVDMVILDDGFQHRRLHRDRDLVCLDARRPWAGGFLPAGLLREPPRALRRADAVVLTRAEGLSSADLQHRRQALWHLMGKQRPVYASRHAPKDILVMPSGATLPCTQLWGQRLWLLAAIARPNTFRRLVTELGGEVVGHTFRRDHHRHTRDELTMALAQARQVDARLLVTEKDAVKLAGMLEEGEGEGEYWVLRIDLQFLEDSPGLPLLGDL